MSKVYNLIKPYINTGTLLSPVWTQIKKSTVFTITMNAETEDFDYISDENKTTEIKAYAPTIPQDISILPGEDDYDYFNELFHSRPKGTDAHKEVLIVFLKDVTGSDYRAWKTDAVIKFTDYNAVDGKINLEIGFAGTITDGTVAYTGAVPSFSPST